MAEHQHQPSGDMASAAAAAEATTGNGTAENTRGVGGGEKEAPGVRATRLQAIYAQALGGTLRKLSWANFAGCYPTIARRAEGVLRKLQEQMASQLQGRCETAHTPAAGHSRRAFAPGAGAAPRTAARAARGDAEPNALLVDEVRRQRAEADALLARLEDAAADVRGANEALGEVVAALAEETRLDAEHV
ncbi:hypothetical protein MY8738_006145 [Beauveria namnaoensis]